MEKFIDYVLQFGNLNKQQIDLIKSKATEIELDKFYTPSEYLQAIEDCKMVVFPKQDWKEISEIIIGWDNIIQKIIAKHHTEKIRKRSDLISQDATERYLGFLEKFPTLANRIPLSYIASYLGMTASSLSRIRKNIR